MRHEYIKQLIRDGVINIVYIRLKKNLTNPLTKGLARDLVKDTYMLISINLLHIVITIDVNVIIKYF